MERDWCELSNKAFAAKKFLCVGLDPALDKRWPNALDHAKNNIVFNQEIFCKDIINSVGDIAGFLKPNWAFFLQYGQAGLFMLKNIIQHANTHFPDLAIILDMKMGDIGDTNKAYVSLAFDELGADAVTIHPYLGKQANLPFLNRADKGIFVLCHTSNPGAEEFQHQEVSGEPLYQVVARKVSEEWNDHDNCGLVVGATFPIAIVNARVEAPSLPFLIPGIGKQGGDLEQAIQGAVRKDGTGFIINSSSGIIYAENPRTAALQLHNDILKAIT